jgi:glutathione peroxidase
MLRLLAVAVAVTLLAGLETIQAADKEKSNVPTVLNFKMKAIDGKEVNLADYQGKVILFVNVASKCGLTPQYKQLEALYEKYQDRGFVVLGFPCNQFGKQEPGTEKEISEFCTSKYGVKFPMFAKIEVNGPGRNGLYKVLIQQAPAEPTDISWNFEKFLVNRKGEVVKRFAPRTKPDAPEVVSAIEAELAR